MTIEQQADQLIADIKAEITRLEEVRYSLEAFRGTIGPSLNEAIQQQLSVYRDLTPLSLPVPLTPQQHQEGLRELSTKGNAPITRTIADHCVAALKKHGPRTARELLEDLTAAGHPVKGKAPDHTLYMTLRNALKAGRIKRIGNKKTGIKWSVA